VETMISTVQLAKYSEETQQKIQELSENSYDVDSMMEFIAENSEYDFNNFYEEYVELGEENGYDAVDWFINLFSCADLKHFADSYQGEYSSFRSFAEQYFDDVYLHEIPEYLHSYIDYDKFTKDLNYDYVFSNGYVYNSNF
jgi:antirestriction protein